MIFVLDNQTEKVTAVLNNTSPEACPYWNDKHVETINDALSTYEFEAPLQHESSESLISENYVARADMDGDYILFKIKTANEILSSNGIYSKKVFAENAAVAELNGSIIRPRTLTGYNAPTALDYVLNGTRWKRGDCDFLGTATIPLTDYPTALSALHSVAEAFDGELIYRVTLKNGILNRYIDLVEKRGQNRGKRFEYHKDINGLERLQDSTNLATALIGLGPADSKGVRMTFASVNGGLDWVGDDDALDRYGKDGYHIFGVYEDDNAQTPQDLLNRTKKELSKRKTVSLSYIVDVLLLETLADWSHESVRIGDWGIKVLDLTFTPDIALDSRVISLERSYTDPTKDKALLGEFKSLSLSIPAAIRDMQKTLKSNQGVLAGKEASIWVSDTPPLDTDRKWMDTSVIPNVLKRHDGVTWISAGGEQGPQGVPGPKGDNGLATYTWLKYADTPTTGMSDDPTGKAYIGLAYNKLTPNESSDYGDYKWSLTRGVQGVQGPPGDDGQPTYTWIKYANTPTTGMSNLPTGKDYIGLAYNKSSPIESNVYEDYAWSLIKGDKGEDAYKVEIVSSNGNIFKASKIDTVLTARVYKGWQDVTDDIVPGRFIWKRVSKDTAGDTAWNNKYLSGTKSVVITSEDVYGKATFFCDILEV